MFELRFLRWLLLIGLLNLVLAGCGQKGDLYLPDRGRGAGAARATS